MGLKKQSGFTLLEVMIVLVILAVLAGLAVPMYMAAAEKSRKEEAIQTLGMVRTAQQAHMTERNEYASTFNELTFDPTVAMTGNVPHFAYTLSGGGAGSSTYTATATRNALNRPVGVNAYTVTIVQDGTVASSY